MVLLQSDLEFVPALHVRDHYINASIHRRALTNTFHQFIFIIVLYLFLKKKLTAGVTIMDIPYIKKVNVS